MYLGGVANIKLVCYNDIFFDKKDMKKYKKVNML